MPPPARAGRREKTTVISRDGWRRTEADKGGGLDGEEARMGVTSLNRGRPAVGAFRDDRQKCRLGGVPLGPQPAADRHQGGRWNFEGRPVALRPTGSRPTKLGQGHGPRRRQQNPGAQDSPLPEQAGGRLHAPQGAWVGGHVGPSIYHTFLPNHRSTYHLNGYCKCWRGREPQLNPFIFFHRDNRIIREIKGLPCRTPEVRQRNGS